MDKQLLVPLDGSALAEAVIPHTELLARHTGQGLLLLHVVTPSETSQTLLWSVAAPAELRREWEEARLAQTHAYLAALAARLQAKGLQVQTDVLADNDPAAAIVGRAERDPAVSMIAMTSHGRTGISRWFLGSVAAKVLQAAPKPLLLLRAREHLNGSIVSNGYRTIAVPLDGSAFAEQALDHAEALATATGADIVLMMAVMARPEDALLEAGSVPARMRDYQLAESDRADHYLKQIADRLASGGIHVHTRLTSGEPAGAILDTSAQVQADLIVMASHGRTGLSSRWLGGVAAKVAQGAEIPVLLIRAHDAANPAP